jgi:HK97 gp10 family phage protein
MSKPLMKATFKLDNAQKIADKFAQLGEMSQRTVQRAARKGATFTQRRAKAEAPVDLGNLKKGIRIYGERTTKKGKKVYMVVFARSMNHIFQKFNAEARAKLLAGQKANPSAYYPASQEFGWRAVNGRKIPGKFFMKRAVADNRERTSQIMYDELDRQLVILIKKKFNR